MEVHFKMAPCIIISIIIAAASLHKAILKLFKNRNHTITFECPLWFLHWINPGTMYRTTMVASMEVLNVGWATFFK